LKAQAHEADTRYAFATTKVTGTVLRRVQLIGTLGRVTIALFVIG